MGPTIYISHVMEDRSKAREIYGRLAQAGFRPWLAAEDVLPGEDWREVCLRELREASVAIFLFSDTAWEKWQNWHTFAKHEMIAALEVQADRRGAPVIIPVRLGPTSIPSDLGRFMAVDLFAPDGWDSIAESRASPHRDAGFQSL